MISIRAPFAHTCPIRSKLAENELLFLIKMKDGWKWRKLELLYLNELVKITYGLIFNLLQWLLNHSNFCRNRITAKIVLYKPQKKLLDVSNSKKQLLQTLEQTDISLAISTRSKIYIAAFCRNFITPPFLTKQYWITDCPHFLLLYLSRATYLSFLSFLKSYQTKKN